jgi:DNA-binding transcriptional LysR family regulator
VTVPVSGNLRANNGEALIAAAVAGQGVVYVPTFLVADEIRAGRLIAMELDHSTLELPVSVLYPSDRRPPAKVRAFLDFLGDHVKFWTRWNQSMDT